ncbi:hypothetical protein [Mucilaginibacter sp.]|uniref:hypothetical protein n=1 Tax=Mucilaginibacter sp. TaxID=1882438 RepID=UPI00261C4156|nr:hypothetical protein [Mucilaginibacter sp.]MDB4921897.1 hypothetical protein [Mucilaginibacter sp.]
MKKILLSTIVLIAFSFSIILFQISCKKEAKAQTSSSLTPATTSKLGGVIPDGETIAVDAAGKISVAQQGKIVFIKYGSATSQSEVWTANYDGSGAAKVNLALPVDLSVAAHANISPDHKTLFVSVFDAKGNAGIYSCGIDGSNPKLIISGNIDVTDAY